MNVTADQLDKGADALRLFEMKGRVTLPWDRISSAQRSKWRDKARAVLNAVEIPFVPRNNVYVVPASARRGER
jgi:hypothetical protein